MRKIRWYGELNSIPDYEFVMTPFFSVAVNNPSEEQKRRIKNDSMGGLLLHNVNRATKSRTVAKNTEKDYQGRIRMKQYFRSQRRFSF